MTPRSTSPQRQPLGSDRRPGGDGEGPRGVEAGVLVAEDQAAGRHHAQATPIGIRRLEDAVHHLPCATGLPRPDTLREYGLRTAGRPLAAISTRSPTACSMSSGSNPEMAHEQAVVLRQEVPGFAVQ